MFQRLCRLSDVPSLGETLIGSFPRNQAPRGGGCEERAACSPMRISGAGKPPVHDAKTRWSQQLGLGKPALACPSGNGLPFSKNDQPIRLGGSTRTLRHRRFGVGRGEVG